MKYFTPELYVRGNSMDDETVDAAEAEWEAARAAYRARLADIASTLIPDLRRFEAELNLHDAELIGPARESESEVVLIARLTDTSRSGPHNSLAILRYRVTTPPIVTYPIHSHVFNPARPEWLYDEIDEISPGVFSHEVFVSDGRVIRLEFEDFSFAVAPLLEVPSPAMAG